MPIVGCYSLDLYCENEDVPNHPNHPPACESLRIIGQFIGYDRAQCFRNARKAGWKISLKNRTAICPYCRGIKSITERGAK